MGIYDAWERGRQSARDQQTRSGLAKFLQGDQSALPQVYANDPQAAMGAQTFMGQQQEAAEDRFGKLSGIYAQTKDPSVYQQIRPLAKQLLGADLPESLDDPADLDGSLKAATAWAQAYGGMSKGGGEQFTLSPGSARYDANGKLLVQQPFQDKPEYDVQVINGVPYYIPKQPQMETRPQGVTGGGATVLNDAFFKAQEQAESGGNPNAVSPKGAFGPMQIMPETAADPGFGMASLPRNATPEQNREFGREYMTRITQEMGGDPVAGLMAYNWGIGNAQKAIQAAGGDVQAALARAPRETQQYVTRIMGQGAPAGAIRVPGIPAAPGRGKDAPSGYQWEGDRLAPIPGGPADRKANPTDADMAKGEQTIRKELSDRIKEPRTVLSMFQKVQGAASQPSAANDLAMIFAYMKMLDPGSVVREQEFANAQNAAGVPDQIRNAYNKALRGERLNIEQRAQFVSSARQIADQASREITNLTREYQGIAEQYGYDTRRATGMADFRNVNSRSAPAQSSADDDLINKWITR